MHESHLNGANVATVQPDDDGSAGYPLMAEAKPPRVLLVEDNEVNQALAIAILTRLGYQGDIADNGQQAVEQVTRGRYGLVLMEVRWHHPEHGPVPPDEFIPIAESTALIQPLGQFVLEASLNQARRWQEAGLPLHLAVNLSVRNLLEPTLVDRVAEMVGRSGVPPGALTLEITESGVMKDPEAAIAVLWGLRRVGVRLSVDDFGTGYSSLAYLKRLPVDEVKLDKSFVLNMTADPHDAAIVRSTIELAHNLGLQLVAEGVEDQETLELLAALGCDLVQGYHLARPMPADQLVGLQLHAVPFAASHPA